MMLSPSFDKRIQDQVCKLNRSLYGLKQSPIAWFDRFFNVLDGYNQDLSDHTMFLKRIGDLTTIILVCVDDVILTINDENEIDWIKDALNE